MARWTELMAANNWCDQFVRNGGLIERADYRYMADVDDSFSWADSPEGQEAWDKRFDYFEHCYDNIKGILCR